MDYLDVYESIQKSITAQEKPHLRESKNLETNQPENKDDTQEYFTELYTCRCIHVPVFCYS